jgi:8-oxo-dGTP pyrophosphatase MutT (NUDIX family)
MKTDTPKSPDAEQADYSRICDELRAIVEKDPTGEYKGFCIVDEIGEKQPESFALTADDAWTMFCWPALRREAYEEAGYKPVATMSRQKRKVKCTPSNVEIDHEHSL